MVSASGHQESWGPTHWDRHFPALLPIHHLYLECHPFLCLLWLPFIPRMRDFKVLPSQHMCWFVSACFTLMCTAHAKIVAHVEGSVSTFQWETAWGPSYTDGDSRYGNKRRHQATAQAEWQIHATNVCTCTLATHTEQFSMHHFIYIWQSLETRGQVIKVASSSKFIRWRQ